MIVLSSYDLWYAFKPFIEQEQIRGLDSVTMFQLSSRFVDYGTVGRMTGVPKLESKQAFKNRVGGVFKHLAHSPDEADAAAHTLQMAIQGYGFYPGQEMKLDTPFLAEKMYYHTKAIIQEQEHHERRDVRNIQANFTSGLEDTIGIKKLF